MQGIIRAIPILRHGVLQHSHVRDAVYRLKIFSHFERISYTRSKEHQGLENTTIAEVLAAKGEGPDGEGSLLWCCTDDTVYDAVKHMTQKNVGSLVVVKPGEPKLIAGIITERDYLRKIIVQGRSSKSTKVGEIMTDENKLITVNTDTNILHAMQLMIEKHIRHVPVIDKRIVGMISIVDVVRAVMEKQNDEVKRLNEFIKGDYY
ncbi:CBS domain-containing protein CBSX3, mitochondrial-like [Tasmannia lanceolata]|uniref:CBS domain-containing protein CBSX3, mitochondrial-like n=1 Tax=Tasmannia lanceolata TaxID=3420 RepID=UPI00406472D7